MEQKTTKEMWTKIINDARFYDGSPQMLMQLISHFEAQGYILSQKCEQCSVSGWRAFEDELPAPMQEIWIVWPSGNYPPEYRKLTEDELKNDWSDMRWMPVPAYR